VANGHFVVGGLGRLHESKGWDVLCRAAPQVREAVPSAAFVVLGEGPERGNLERMADASGVRFLGYRESAPSLIAGFDVLVVPSRFEAFGRVVAEAMHMGVPVVASEVGGLPEVVGDCGLLVPPDRPDLLARQIVRLAESPTLTADLVSRGRKRAQELFELDEMIRGTTAAYASVTQCR
jgi:glycosyltransferase involved in cell wall biosynthesis